VTTHYFLALLLDFVLTNTTVTQFKYRFCRTDKILCQVTNYVLLLKEI